MIRKLSKSAWLTVAALAVTVAIMPFDLAILGYVQKNSDAKVVFDIITEFGRSGWYLVPSAIVMVIGIYLWRIKKKLTPRMAAWTYRAMLLFSSISAAGIIVNIIKPFVARSRPREFLRHEMYGFWEWPQVLGGKLSDYNSFPSGHAATALSAAVAICLMLPEKYRWWRILILVIGGLTAASRVMISVHYTSDIIVGSLIGAWAAVLCNRYLLRAEWAAAISRPATLQ